MKPHLACDWNEKKVQFPMLAQPKIDGVRALNLAGTLTGRSLKEHRNRHTTSLFSHSQFLGFDGEMVGTSPTAEDCCRVTTSLVSTLQGEPFIQWWLFDYLAPHVKHEPYGVRYEVLKNEVSRLQQDPVWQHRIRVVPSALVGTLEELLDVEARWLAEGYEGVILRDPNGLHKDGRCTVREGAYLRIKRFVEEEAIVEELVEAQKNQNEAMVNALGRTERSSHKENMVLKGMIGALVVRAVKTGELITVGPGTMPHEDRILFWEQPEMIINRVIKYKHFPKGVKDLPRFPTFQSFRADSDIGEYHGT